MADHAVEHTVSITAYQEKERDDYHFAPPTTVAVAEVEPPITEIDDETMLRDIVLGKEWARVNLRKLYATARATVFRVESSASEQARRHEDIQEIARRLGHMANNPQDVLAMMEDRVFAEQMPEPRLEPVPVAPPQAEEEPPTPEPQDTEPKEGGVVVHLAPVEVPPLAVNVPPVPRLEDMNVKPEDLPPVEIPEAVAPQEPAQPSVFGPPRAGLTRLAPEARILPWPPRASDGKHARKDPADN